MSNDDSDEELERAERIRDRRGSRSGRGSQSGDSTGATESPEAGDEQTAQTEKTSRQSQNSQRSQTTESEQSDDSKRPEDQRIKERTHETFYLREDLQQELRKRTGQANLNFELEYGVELGKNRHLRPLLLYLGAQQLEEMSPDEIEATLNTIDVLDTVDTE